METPEPPVITTAQASYGCHKKTTSNWGLRGEVWKDSCKLPLLQLSKRLHKYKHTPKKIIMTNTHQKKKKKAEGHFSNKIILQRHKDSAKKGT